MKISKGKIIRVIIVIYFTVFAFININKEKDMNKEILKEVVYVTDGKVIPENEGKLVLVSGKIDYNNLVGFIELENFSSIKASRKVEDYVKVFDEENNEYEYKWKEREKALENAGGDYLKTIVSEEKVSDIKIGNFELDDKGLSLIPTDKYYSKQEKVGDLITKGIYYSNDPDEENLKEGDMKITYKYYDLESNPYLSVLAVQKGNSFIPYQVDKKKSFYQVFTSKVDTEKKLTKELDLNVKRTKKGKFLFIFMILGVGIFLIVDNKSNKQGV